MMSSSCDDSSSSHCNHKAKVLDSLILTREDASGDIFCDRTNEMDLEKHLSESGDWILHLVPCI